MRQVQKAGILKAWLLLHSLVVLNWGICEYKNGHKVDCTRKAGVEASSNWVRLSKVLNCPTVHSRGVYDNLISES